MLDAVLRPLSVGELLDRAVTLFVRNIPSIAAVTAAAYVPYLAFTFALHWALQTFALSDLSRPADAFTNGLGVIIWALTRTALARTAGTALHGTQSSLSDAYRRAWRRLVPQLVTMAIAVGLYLVIVAAAVVVAAVLMKVGSALEPFLPGRPNTSPAIVAASGVLVAPFIVWFWLAYQIAAVRVAETAASPRYAFIGALHATLDKSLRWRALVVGFVIVVAPLAVGYGAVTLGRTIADEATAFAVEKTLRILVSSFTEAFAIVCVVLYDRDARVRSKGLDLVQLFEADDESRLSADRTWPS